MSVFEIACLHNGLFILDFDQEIKKAARLIAQTVLNGVNDFLNGGFRKIWKTQDMSLNIDFSKSADKTTIVMFRYSQTMMIFLKKSSLKKEKRNFSDSPMKHGSERVERQGLTMPS
jgi:hypothetical protein